MNALDRLEDDTADLILRLQLEDLAALDSNADNTRGVNADVRLARRLFEAELKGYGLLRGFDRVDAAEGGTANEDVEGQAATDDDTAEVNATHGQDAQEEAAYNDNAGEDVANEATTADANTADVITANEDVAEDHVAEAEEKSADKNGKDEATVEAPDHTSVPHVDCTACGDSFPIDNSYTAPCSHVYHTGCLERMISEAMTNETSYPPRCCSQDMDLDSALKYLPDAFANEFQAKRGELDDDHRTYCHVPTCSAYIPSANKAENIGRCPKCQESTCAICNGAPHQDRDCPEDEGTKTILDTARQSGWQQCRTCGRVIERNTGCYHITCVCAAQFCYLCGARWKTCACEHFPAAARPVAVRPPTLPELDAEHARQRQERLRRIRRCRHTTTNFVHGPFTCEECEEALETFTLRCDDCTGRICRRCRDDGRRRITGLPRPRQLF